MPLSEENSHLNQINFNILFYESPQPMWILNNTTLQFLEVNQAAVQTYGYSREEFFKMTLRDILVQGDHEYLQSGHMTSNETITIESHHRLRSLEQRHVEVTLFPFIFKEQKSRLIYIRDITAKKKREALLEYLTRAGEVLALERDTDFLLTKISDLIVPKFADWFTINVVRGEVVELLLVKNQDPEYIKWAYDYRRRNPITVDEGGLTGHVIRTGESSLVPIVTPEMLEQAITDKEQLDKIKRLNLRSSIVTPMKVEGQVVGTINFISTVEGKQYDEIDLQFAKDFSTRIALALENARLHEQAQHSLEKLEQADEEAQAMNEELTAINEELSASNEQLIGAVNKAQESEERFRRMADDADVYIAVSDETSGSTYFNKAWCNLTGRSMEDLLEFGWVDLVHPEDKDRFVNIYLDAFEKRVHFTGEFRVLNKEGEYRCLFASCPVRFNPDGSFAGYISSCIDITDRKQIDSERQKNIDALQILNSNISYRKALFEAQNETIPDAILIVDTKGHILSFNQNFIRLWRIPQEIIDRKDDSAALQFAMTQLVDPEGFIERVNYCYAHPEEVDHEEVIFKDGRIIERFGTGVNGEDGTSYGWAWYFKDITGQRHLQKQKDEFISTVSHELKTPLTSIKAYAQLLHRSLPDNQSLGDKSFLARMNNQIQHLEQLIRDLLDITRVDARKLDFKNETFDMGVILSDLIEDLQMVSPSHKLILQDNESVKVKTDKGRIIQVITNLVTNAVKYSPNAEMVYISSRRQGASLVCSVKDFGIGIAEDQQQFIFDRFHQIERSNSGTGFNLGLGLYISKEIITNAGGEIWFESEPGKGSTFYCSIPGA